MLQIRRGSSTYLWGRSLAVKRISENSTPNHAADEAFPPNYMQNTRARRR